MTRKQLEARLTAGEIVMLSREDWERHAGGFDVLEDHDTGIAGHLLLVRGKAGLAAVEAPEPEQRVLRPLPDEAAGRRFIRERLETYDRMWDGCGCKIDYRH